MKSLFFITTLLTLCSFNAFSQRIEQENVPAVVLNSFHLKFPNAESVKWRLKDGVYHIDCRVNHKENLVTLSRRGTLLKHAQDLYINEIPKTVIHVIEERLQFFDIHDADKIWENGETIYIIKFKIDSKDRIFWIGEKGSLIKYRKELLNNEIPKEVMAYIHKNFGELDIERARYLEEDNRIFYLIEGEIYGDEHRFWISNELTLIEHRYDLNHANIPVPVLKTVKSECPDCSIRDADLLYKNNTTTYTIRMRTRNNQTVYFVLSPDGQVLHIK